MATRELALPASRFVALVAAADSASGYRGRYGWRRLVHDESRRGIRPFERQVLRLIGVADFLAVKAAPRLSNPGPGRPDLRAGR